MPGLQSARLTISLNQGLFAHATTSLASASDQGNRAYILQYRGPDDKDSSTRGQFESAAQRTYRSSTRTSGGSPALCNNHVRSQLDLSPRPKGTRGSVPLDKARRCRSGIEMSHDN